MTADVHLVDHVPQSGAEFAPDVGQKSADMSPNRCEAPEAPSARIMLGPSASRTASHPRSIHGAPRRTSD